MKTILSVIAMVFMLACSNDKPRSLTAAERKQVSQRYADTVRMLTPIVDSLCQANRQALILQLSDSLYAERVADLERQRQRFEL